MLPRWHVFWGAIFTLILWLISPATPWYNLLLLFLSSIFIDLDHYILAVHQTNRWSLSQALKYYKKLLRQEQEENAKGIRVKGHFFLFHTIEFHVLIGILALFWDPFFYIFIGMIFHSMLDLASMVYKDRFYRREFFLFNWTREKLS